jgi:DNA (cytosine-5)-methyltransferase 1
MTNHNEKNSMEKITFGSVCSGIEAASVAWNPLGWEAAWLSEIEPFPCALLAHHYPDVPNLGDMTKIAHLIRDGFAPAPDVFCGGTPCQAFSVAGLRNSLDDARGNLSLTFCEIANEIDTRRAATGLLPSVIFWENVPGVLSTKDNAFGCFLAGLAGEDDPLVPAGDRWTDAGCVYGPERTVAWRVLDAQYFGVAQRRRRVFVVASARNGFDPAAVLFEFDGVRRDSAPSRTPGKDITHDLAPCLTSSGGGVERGGDTRGQDPVVAVCPTLRAGGNKTGGDRPPGTDVDTADSLIVMPLAFHVDAQPDQQRFDPHVSAALTCSQKAGVAYGISNQPTPKFAEELSPCLDAKASGGGRMEAVFTGMAVRRLTPRECERLQGFPSIRKEVTIRICLDHQKNSVDAALSCRKWPTSVWPAVEEKWMPHVPAAALDSSTSQANPDLLAALRVRTNSVDELLEIHSHGRSIWPVSNAESSGKYPLLTPTGSIAAALVQAGRALAQEIMAGRAVSQASIKLSIQALNGKLSAPKSGDENAACASDAASDAQGARFTMSDLGRATPQDGSTVATLLCSALAAISSCIPSEMLPANFSLILDVETPYTLIPMPDRRSSRKEGDRRAAPRMSADGPRYKALGNSWAVPVVRWIGERIDRAMRDGAA